MSKRQSNVSRETQSEQPSTRGADSDIRPDARERFERAVDIAVATKPMHRETAPSRKRRQK